jgi:L-amino acid N-acyltransferase YncA
VKDLDALKELCARLSRERGSLMMLRRETLDPSAWIERRIPLAAVAEGSQIVGFAAALPDGQPYGAPRCAELLVGVLSDHRRKGAGRAAVHDLLRNARTMGLWKLVAFAGPEDAGAQALLARTDFRAVGTLEKHVQREGIWRNVELYERLLMSARRSNPAIAS